MGQDQLDEFLKEQLSNHISPINSDEIWAGLQNKNNDEADQIIKDKLFDHKSEIDTDVLWANIDKKLNPSRRFGIIASAILVLLIIGGIGIYMNVENDIQSEDLTNKATSKISLETDQDDNSTYTQKNTESVNDNSTIINKEKEIANINNSSKKISTESNFSAVDLKLNSKKNAKEISAQIDNGIGNDVETKSSTLNENSAQGNVRTAPSVLENKKNAVAETKNLKPQNIKPELVVDNNVVDKTAKTNQTIESEPEINNTDAKSFTSSEETTNLNLNLSLLTSIDNKSIDQLSSLNNRILSTDLPQVDHCFRNSRSIDCYNHRGKRSWFYLTGFSTLDYYKKSMRNQAEFTDPYYVDARNISQAVQISNRTGLQVKWLHKNGFYVKTGLEFGMLREQFRHTTRDTITTIIPNQILNININSNGDSTLTYGNKLVDTLYTKVWRVNNSLRTFGVPLTVGYQKKMRKMHVGIELGVLYNFNQSFSGWLMGPSIAPIKAKNYFKNSNDFNITGGVNLIYEINSKFNWFLLGSFKRNLNTINLGSENLIDQKNTTFGLGVGIEMKI